MPRRSSAPFRPTFAHSVVSCPAGLSPQSASSLILFQDQHHHLFRPRSRAAVKKCGYALCFSRADLRARNAAITKGLYRGGGCHVNKSTDYGRNNDPGVRMGGWAGAHTVTSAGKPPISARLRGYIGLGTRASTEPVLSEGNFAQAKTFWTCALDHPGHGTNWSPADKSRCTLGKLLFSTKSITYKLHSALMGEHKPIQGYHRPGIRHRTGYKSFLGGISNRHRTQPQKMGNNNLNKTC